MRRFLLALLALVLFAAHAAAQTSGVVVIPPKLPIGCTNGQFAQFDGTLWVCVASPATAPGGSNTQVQFNNSGAFGGDADLTFSGDTLTATKVAVGNGTVSSPGLQFGGDSGLYHSNDRLFVSSFGEEVAMFYGNDGYGLQLHSSAPLSWSSGALNAASDVLLFRVAAGALEQRNSTNLQRFSVYGTYTDANNYERLSLRQPSSGAAGGLGLVAEKLDAGAEGQMSLTLESPQYFTLVNAGRSIHANFDIQDPAGSSGFGFFVGYGAKTTAATNLFKVLKAATTVSNQLIVTVGDEANPGIKFGASTNGFFLNGNSYLWTSRSGADNNVGFTSGGIAFGASPGDIFLVRRSATELGIDSGTDGSATISFLDTGGVNYRALVSASGNAVTLGHSVGSTSINGTSVTIVGPVVINEDGLDSDTRIESDTDANLFFLDAGANSGAGRVGIGTAAPQYRLDLSSAESATLRAVGAGVTFIDATSGGGGIFGYDGNRLKAVTSYIALQTGSADRDLIVSSSKALTETTATSVVQIAVAAGSSVGATVEWTVCANDATDYQCRRGRTYIAAVNKASTETCSVGDVGTTVVAASAGTLTVTTGCSTTPADAVDFTIDATSSLTQTSLTVTYRVFRDHGTGAITPQ